MSTARIEAKNRISQDRSRTNLFRSSEQYMLSYLCTVMPEWVSSNLLTAIGFSGAFIITGAFWMAKENIFYLSLAIFGFAVQWFGDSLDGRMAYYRNTPRKWYGFSLDMIVDWISTIIIGIGFYFYVPEEYRLFVFTFVALYGWTMITALLKYRITDKYEIDSGLFGPTELRIFLCMIIAGEIIYPGVMKGFTIAANLFLIVMNTADFVKLLRLGDQKDKEDSRKSL